MAAIVETFTADAEKVMAVLPNFKYSEALVEESVAEEIRCQLKGMLNEAAETKATIQSAMDSTKQQLQEAETALEKIKDSERQGVSELEIKVNALIETQVEMQSVEKEKKKVELENQDDILMSEQLREAKSKNIAINEGAFCSLLNGSWKSEKDQSEKLETLKEYLQEIGTEKTLVAAADGLITKPEVRGDFDKMAIDCITEELSEKLKKLEETMSDRAPAEREVQAEVLGLEALLDICQEKAASAEEQHKQAEVMIKGFKTEIKTCKQQVTKYIKELETMTAKMSAEEDKANTLQEASVAVDRLVEFAKAAVEKAAAEKAEKEAAEKAAAEKAAAEKAEAEAAVAKAEAEKQAAEAAKAAVAKAEAEKQAAEAAKAMADVEVPAVAAEDLEPPAKRMRTQEDGDEPAKEAKLEAQVASPARVRVSIG